MQSDKTEAVVQDGDQQRRIDAIYVYNWVNHQPCAIRSELGYLKITSHTYGRICPYGNAMSCGRCKARCSRGTEPWR